MSATTRQVLDTQSDVQLKDFNGNRSKFEHWAYMFESYVHLLGWGSQVEEAIRQPTSIDPEKISSSAKECNGDLYWLLATKVQGP